MYIRTLKSEFTCFATLLSDGLCGLLSDGSCGFDVQGGLQQHHYFYRTLCKKSAIKLQNHCT